MCAAAQARGRGGGGETTTAKRSTTPTTPTTAPATATSEPTRRAALATAALSSLSALAAATAARPARAVQGLTAGRIPGLSAKPDAEGLFEYRRPEGKSGGHGVGWSEIPRYGFRVPAGWEETPVSIADLGGTEIDLRFGGADGQLSVVVAPVLRFVDVGFNADVRIEELGPPDRIVAGFAPELFGAPLQEGDTLETDVERKGDLTYYTYVLKPPAGGPGGNVGGRRLVAATAFKNRLFLMAASANPRQWRRAEGELRAIVKSFNVSTK